MIYKDNYFKIGKALGGLFAVTLFSFILSFIILKFKFSPDFFLKILLISVIVYAIITFVRCRKWL